MTLAIFAGFRHFNFSEPKNNYIEMGDRVAGQLVIDDITRCDDDVLWKRKVNESEIIKSV